MIRPPTMMDFNKLENFANSAEDKWKDILKQIVLFSGFDLAYPTYRSYIAEVDSKIVGFVYGYVLPKKVLYPQFVYVLPEYRCRGIAEKLNAELEKESGCTMSVIYYSRQLHGHYEKLGFRSKGKDEQEESVLEVAIKEFFKYP